jgi:hypothetical protein
MSEMEFSGSQTAMDLAKRYRDFADAARREAEEWERLAAEAEASVTSTSQGSRLALCNQADPNS